MTALQQFYQDEFHADPRAILDDACQDIINWASPFGIDLAAIFHEIQLPDQGGEDKLTKYASYAAMNKALPSELKSKATLTSHVKTAKNGIRYPSLGLIIKGSMETMWSGYEYLTQRFERESQYQLTDKEHKEREQRQAREKAAFQQRMAERQAKEAAKREEAERQRQLDKQWLENYHQAFNDAPAEMGTTGYFRKKKITAICALSNVKRMTDNRVGDHVSIPMVKLDGITRATAVAYQRVIDKPLIINGKSQSKMVTKSVDEKALHGAMHIFGNLVNGQDIWVGEGYATVASALLAKNASAGVMAYSANNLPLVVDTLRKAFPESRLYILVDNDHVTQAKGKGNPGVLAAITVLNKHHDSGKVYCHLPNLSEMSEEQREQSSDFNDVHCVLGLDAVSQQLKGRQTLIDWRMSALHRNLFAMRFMKNSDIRRHIKKTVLSGMHMVPGFMTAYELYTMIADELRLTDSERKGLQLKEKLRYLKNFLQYIDQAHTNRAMSVRSFSSRITDPERRPEHIVYHQFEQHKIDDNLVKFMRQCNGPIILRAGMGSRKSSKAIRTFMREAEQAILAAHRQTLTWDLFSTMASAQHYDNLGATNDILHYQDDGATEMGPYAKKLVVCINSIIKGIFRPLVNKHDFFAMDEATQTLRAILTGNSMAYPVQVYNMLKAALAATTEQVLLCDADANDHLVTLLERANEARVEMGLEPWPQIHVIDLPVSVDVNGAPIRIDHTDPNTCFDKIEEAIKSGKRCLVATDSTKMAENVEELVNQLNNESDKNTKKIRCLYVSRDTKPEKRVQDFQDDPKGQAKHYDVLVYSPAISSGVSIDVKHFEAHFGVFYGEVVPSDAIQMLRRDRTATQFTLGLGKLNNTREKDMERLVRAFVENLQDTQCHMMRRDGTFNLGTHDTEFNRFRMELTVEENRSRADFSNQILRILSHDGYNVQRLDTDDATITAAKKRRKELTAIVEMRRFNLHMSATTPDEKRHEELLKQRNLSEVERAELNRYDIENVQCDEVTPSSYEFFQNGGLKKCALFELLQMSQEEADKFDQLERRTEYTFNLQLPDSQYPQKFTVRADSEDEARLAMQRQFAGVRISDLKEENGVIEFKVKGNGIDDQRKWPIEAGVDPKQAISQWVYETYCPAEVLSMTQAPVVEISFRANLGRNRSSLVQYLTTCGFTVENGQISGKATQEGMKQAMADLIATEAKRDVFNITCKMWGGRIDAGMKKRPTDLLKLVLEQLGLEAADGRETVANGRGKFWTITKASWIAMHDRHQRRKDKKVTAFSTQELENIELPTIHDLSISSKDTRKIVDPACAQSQKSSRPYNQLIAQAAELVGVPLKWASELFSADEQGIFESGKLTLRHLCMAVRDCYMTDFGHTLNQGEFTKLKNWTPEGV